MPLSGGPSAKIGLRYELLWTVFCMTQVLDRESDSIRLEPLGDEGNGVEFSLKTPSGTEFHQVKRQKSGQGQWSLNVLASKGVLSHFYNKLSQPNATCVFVSAHAAHTLDELADRARNADSWEQFGSCFLSAGEWSSNFAKLHGIWRSSSPEDTYERLKRTQVRTIDEASLREAVNTKLGSLVVGEPDNVREVLSSLALDELHQQLDSSYVWNHLRSRGFGRPTWAKDSSVANALSEMNQTYLAGIQPTGIAGEVVHRSEVKQVLQIFDDDRAGNTVLVTGRAGVGKSSAISQTLAEIENRKWPLLSLRVDRLEPCRLPEQVGEQLGLPASPVRVLASIANGKDCLLILDQLDAISLASGRNPEFFDCIGAILSQAQHHSNMRVLSACRKFDIDNDHRLRELVRDGGIAKEVSIGPFDEQTVRHLVTKLGMDGTKLNPRQVSLLSLPVHLRLLSEVHPDESTHSLSFQTSKDLYDRFWRNKLQVLSSRVGVAAIQNVTNSVLEYMDNHETLFVPESLLEEHREPVSLMESENILVKDGSRVSFFHEGFFDYIFARTTVSGEFDLVSYVLNRDQSLFIRSQVRQILLHQRDISPSDALWNVKSILSNENVRIHVKSLVLSLLGSLENPTEDDWRAIEPHLDSDLSQHVWGAISRSPPWFDLLDSTGIIRQWLNGEEELGIGRAVWLLSSNKQDRPDRIGELLLPHVSSSEAWNRWLVSIIANSELGTSRRLFDLAIKVVEVGALDDLLSSGDANGTAWNLVERLAGSNPEWACELIAGYCNRMLAVAQQEGINNPFSGRVGWSENGAHAVTNVANAAPKKFVELLMPFFTTVIEMNAIATGAPPWRDPVWSNRIYEYSYGLNNKLFIAMESAMRCSSQHHPEWFRAYADELATSNYLTIQHLLVRSYQANGKYFADDAVEYLLSNPARLATGYSDSPHWATRQLLGTVTPFCSSDNLARLEQTILEYYPPHELGLSARQFRGHSQLTLLEGLEYSRLSPAASRRLQELRRKFEDWPPPEPRAIEAVWDDSPITDAAAREMSDENWLRAIRRYSSNSPINKPDHQFKGDAIELSHVLEARTKEDPARFAKLIHLIPDDANQVFFEAVLRGLANSDLDADRIVSACLRCHRLPGRPLGVWITRPLESVSDSPLPEDALEMVAWYATQGPDSGEPPAGLGLLDAGINSVRGNAAHTVASLILHSPENLGYFENHLKIMVTDRSVEVRTFVAEALLGVLRHDRDLAVELFTVLCDADERLLSTHYVSRFLRHAVQTHFKPLKPILLRMIKSHNDEVAADGARQVCVASLTLDEARLLARRCVAGSTPVRLGAADVYSANIKMSAYRSECKEILGALFSDPEDEVRRAASNCFDRFEGSDLRDYTNLIASYIYSPAFVPQYSPLIRALEKTTANIPEITLAACERYIDLAGEDAGNIATAASMHAQDVSKLIVRVYRQVTDQDLRSRCLDIIDKMELYRAYGLDKFMDEFER